jgi:hypothetical protein
MWKANGKATTLLLFLDSLFPKLQKNSRCFLWRQSILDVNYSIRISAGNVARGQFGCKKRNARSNWDDEIISKHTVDMGEKMCAVRRHLTV